MKAIINGKIVTPMGVESGSTLLYDERIIGLVPHDQTPPEAQQVDAKGGYVLPGFIDMHIHGYLGEDASDGSYDGVRRMAEGVAKNGVTGFLPTTMTVSYTQLQEAFAQIRKLTRDSLDPAWAGARVLGVNAEGPFINPAKKGAQNATFIHAGDAAFLAQHLDILRVFTIAPEMPGNLECIRAMAGSGVLIAMGHTAADYAQTMAAFDAGVRHVTHLFNAQTPMMHRDPGVVGAALSDQRVSCELIADTFHIHKGLFRLVAKAKGGKLVLITDCTRAGGLADGEYDLGGQNISVRGIECRLADGTIAGSVLKLNEAVRNMLANTDLPVYEAVNMASLNPARAIGVAQHKGSLEAGKDADIVLADGDFNIATTILGGRVIYCADANKNG